MQKYNRVSEILDTIPLKIVLERDIAKMIHLKIITKDTRDITRKHLLQLIPEDILSAKANIGTNVHEGIVSHVNGDFPVLDTDKGLGYYQSYEMWASAYMPDYIFTEKRFYCDALMLTGQIDALVKFPETSPCIVDFKTSNRVSLETWTYQAHFYYYLLTQNGYADLMPVMRFVNLQIDPKTKMGKQAKVVDIQFDPEVMKRCVEYAVKYYEDRKSCFDID